MIPFTTLQLESINEAFHVHTGTITGKVFKHVVLILK